ncbi:hypothetical protein FRX31_013536 [Thalictrum thalictroides]|uniref:Uncharacterized protein n=1 Tax=Thalictrum thalictroides TaxID=46969 RepID=A0A7J6WJ12_THATH|nr:hypothetical protein FRX31_013536 [Thalictrum thalictroides]
MDNLRGSNRRKSDESAKTLLSGKRTLIRSKTWLSTSERKKLQSMGFYYRDAELAGRLGRIMECYCTGMNY